MSDFEQGLINEYRGEIGILAVKTSTGEDVAERVKKSVIRHCEHFRIIKSSQPQRNLEAYRSALNFAGIQTHETQPQVRQTFEYALSVCPAEL